MEDTPAIRWAPKVRQADIRRLYENDSKGLVDEILVDEVGWGLYLRCESILLVVTGRVRCPRCRTVFLCVRYNNNKPHEVFPCPECEWATTEAEFTRSHRDRDLSGVGAIEAFAAFVERYPPATSARERVLLIDRLIHAFHHDLKRSDRPHRTAAINLIEGNQTQVIAFLDRLTYGTESTPGTQEAKSEWRQAVEQMRRKRQDGRPS